MKKYEMLQFHIELLKDFFSEKKNLDIVWIIEYCYGGILVWDQLTRGGDCNSALCHLHPACS